MGMRLDEWRALLTVDDRKSKGNDDFMALCPCHADHDPSLHVTIGEDGGIRMHCFVCDAGNIDVARAMGKTPADVMCDAMTGEDLGRGSRQAMAKPRKTGKGPKKAGTWREGDVWQMGKDKKTPYTIKRIYSYRLADGKEVMRKARLEHTDETGKREKIFSFQYLGLDGIWYSGAGNREGVIYNWPELSAAKASARTVFVVEGEKDADNLARLGYCAVSGAFGGGRSEKLEGKWRPEYTQAIAGAGRVIVIPDNDLAGEQLGRYICRKLSGQVGEVRILHLADSLSEGELERFAKGDFTDWANLRKQAGAGRTEIAAEFEQLAESAPVWQDGMESRFELPQGNAHSLNAYRGSKTAEDGEADDDNGEPYMGIKAYSVKWERLCKVNAKSAPEILCDFVPRLLEEVTLDDGETRELVYVMGGTFAGRELPQARVTAEAMGAMRWPLTVWGSRGNIRPKKGAREMILDAILRGGQRNATARTVYGHTGIRLIDGKPCYLYNGGAIGADGVSVELTNTMKHYTLAPIGGETEAEGAAALMTLVLTQKPRIVLPLLAQAFLAPLYSEMEAMMDPPAYVVYVVGRSGSFKSTLVGYVESMYGEFYTRQHGATFRDTPASAVQKTFTAKDCLYVVDDYNPENDARRRAQMDALASAVITAIADRAGRSGLTATHRQQGEKPARCTCIMTGEQLPNLNEGRLLRLYVVETGHEEIAQDARNLEPYAKAMEQGLYRAAGRGYITRLLARWDGIREEIARRKREAKAIISADADLPREHARMLDAGEHLLIGCGLFVDYMIATGQIEMEMREGWLKESCQAIRENMVSQGEMVADNNPATVYLHAIRSLVRMRTVRICDLLDKDDNRKYMGPDMVGFKDAHFYYFDPVAIERAVRRVLKDTGREIGATAKTVRGMLLDRGICVGDRQNPCKVKTIGGRQQRMLWIPRNVIDGRGENDPEDPKEGFETVDEQTELPF